MALVERVRQALESVELTRVKADKEYNVNMDIRRDEGRPKDVGILAMDVYFPRNKVNRPSNTWGHDH